MTEADNLNLAVGHLREGRWQDYLVEVKRAYGLGQDRIWAALSNFHPTAVDVWAALAARSEGELKEAARWLLPVVKHLDQISDADALALLGYADALPAGWKFKVSGSVKVHIGRRPDLGRELGESLRARSRGSQVEVAVWADAFASGAPAHAAAYVAELLQGQPHTLLLACLVQSLPTGSDQIEDALKAHDPTLSTCLLGAVYELGEHGWRALCRLATHSVQARNELRRALDSGTPDAVPAIANTLYRSGFRESSVTGDLPEILIGGLLRAALADESLRTYIDQTLSGLMYGEEHRAALMVCLKGLRSAEPNVAEAFGDLFGALVERPIEFGAVLTDWLLHPDSSFAGLNSLLSFCASGRADVTLDDAAFAAATWERRVKATRRVLALSHHGPTLCQFAALVAEMDALGPQRLNVAGEILNRAYVEFPGATEEFLRAKTSTVPRSAPQSHVYRSVYASALRWRRILKRLPKRRELIPKEMELEALRASKVKRNRQIMRGAHEMSVFKDIVSSVHLAQGKKYAMYSDFAPPQVGQMSESSYFMELPSSELADPMRGHLDRFHLLQAAR